MVLLTLSGHKFLDTQVVPCERCNRRFRLTNQMSMSLDTSGTVAALFRIHCGKRTAVDDTLFHFLTTHMNDPAATLARKLKLLVLNKYIGDIVEFMLKVKMNLAVIERKNNRHFIVGHFDGAGANQVGTASQATPISDAQSKRVVLKGKLQNLQHKISNNPDIDFKALLARKKRRKSSSNDLTKFRGVGLEKLRIIIASGIATASQFIKLYQEYKGDGETPVEIAALFKNMASARKPDVLLAGWIQTLQIEIRFDENEAQAARDEISRIQSELDALELQVQSRDPVAESVTLEGPTEAKELPKFSHVLDRNGYGARFISRKIINDIQNTHFQNRKSLMVRSMTSNGGRILSMDAEYKMSRRIFVHVGRRGRFRPFKAFSCIRNEYGDVIWWKMLRRPESISEIEADLQLLKERLDRVQGENKVSIIYVDNCCNVRKKLEKLFPGVLIKLDPFHWIKKWDDVLVDPKSMMAAVFRAALSRAIHAVNHDEYNEKLEELRGKLSREPKVQEVLKACNTSVPPPAPLETRVRATVRYFLCDDVDKAAMHLVQREGEERPKMTLKSPTLVRTRLEESLNHVEKNCLSDEPSIPLHVEGGGRCTCARGTPGSEGKNMELQSSIPGFQKASACSGVD